MVLKKLDEPVEPVASPFAFSHRPQPVAPTSVASYKSWKNKEVTADGTKIEKVVNVSSVTEFPDLVAKSSSEPKKSVLEGTSLAAKLKETIAAEEEAAILKRLKKGDTPEMILREGCVSLPLKNYTQGVAMTVPEWVTDTTKQDIPAMFKHKSLDQLAKEREWKRQGIDPKELMLFDEPQDDGEFIPDAISLPDDDSIIEEDNEFIVEQS